MASSNKQPSDKPADSPVESFDASYSQAHPATLVSPVALSDVSTAGTPAPPDSDEDLEGSGQPIDITKFHGPANRAETAALKIERHEKSGELVRACETMIDCLGEDLNREGLQKTPQRMAKALTYFTSGYETCLSGTLRSAVEPFFHFSIQKLSL